MSGELTVHLLNSAILTVVVSLFVLWRYKAAVLNGMMRDDGEALPLPPPHPRALRDAAGDIGALLQFERRRERAFAFAYGLTAFTCALPLAVAVDYLTTAPGNAVGLQPSFTAKMALIYTFACAPMIIASLALPPLRMLAGLAILTSLLTVLSNASTAIEWAVRGFPSDWLDTPSDFLRTALGQLWFIVLFWMTAWPRRMRAVAPITFAALLLFGFAPFIATRPAGNFHESTHLTLNATFLLIALPTGGIAWMRLHQLARSYERKRFSDAQLLARAWWLLLVCSVVITEFVTDSPSIAVVAGAISLLIFPPVNAFAFAKARHGDDVPARTLLVLRVFGHTARTQRLFDRIVARWRLFGPVTTISGPDVAARTIGPGDYLRWLTGRMDEMFVTSRADLDARLAAIDVAPDPDGRYRINAFCCRANAWQATVVELMQRADAVVMDVRGLTSARHGSAFELQQLATRLAPRRLILVADRTTDRSVLQSAFGEPLVDGRVVEIRGARDHNAVFEALLRAAG